MLILGLTGSIGMGKSTTAKLFAEVGVPVYDADAAVHKIYQSEAAPAIEAAFPGTTIDGKVDRANFPPGSCTIRPPSGELEQIVHPMLGASQQEFLETAERSGRPVVVMDIPLLFETGGEKRVDAVVVVTTTPENQRERILARGTMTSAKARCDSGPAIARRRKAQARRFRGGYVARTGAGARPDPRHSGRGR